MLTYDAIYQYVQCLLSVVSKSDVETVHVVESLVLDEQLTGAR